MKGQSNPLPRLAPRFSPFLLPRGESEVLTWARLRVLNWLSFHRDTHSPSLNPTFVELHLNQLATMRRRVKLNQINYQIPTSKRPFSRLIVMGKRTIPVCCIEGFPMFIKSLRCPLLFCFLVENPHGTLDHLH